MSTKLEQRHGIFLPLLVSFLLILAMSVSACQNAGDIQAETRRPVEGEIAEQAGVVESELDRAGQELQQGLDRVGESLERGTHEIGREVGPVVEQVASDATITSKIKAKLTADPQVNPMTIDVDTVNGRVTLNGTVESHDEKTEAEKLARSTAGVRSITNLIQVTGRS